MTFQKLITLSDGKTLEELELLSDAALEQYFAPYFNVTRPTKRLESPAKVAKSKGAKSASEKKPSKLDNLNPEQQAKLKLIREQYGI